MDMKNSNQSYTGLVEKYIGSAYDAVKAVYDNLEEVIKVGEIEDIETIVPNIAAAEEHANEAAQSATDAAASALEADTTVQAFNDFYLGPYAVPPTVDNDGQPLTTGALYLDTAVSPNLMMFWDSIQWQVSYTALSTIDHAVLQSLDADDHTQYLNAARHDALVGNLHDVDFSSLLDVPPSFVGNAGRFLAVNSGETELEYSTISGSYLPLTGGIITSNLTVNGSISSGNSPTAAEHVPRLDYLQANYLNLAGGTLTDDLLGTNVILDDGTIEVYLGAKTNYYGLEFLNNTGDSLGSCSWNSNTEEIHLSQKGNSVGDGNHDTALYLKDGKAKLTAGGGLSNLASLPDHLATKGFTDANYIKSTEDASITGDLTVSGEIFAGWTVRAEYSNTELYSGFAVHDPVGGHNNPVRASFDWEQSTDKVQVAQAGTGTAGNPDTVLALLNGNIEVTAGNAHTTDPTLGNHLTNKTYVDGKFSAINTTFDSVDGNRFTVTNGIITSVTPIP